MVVTDVSNLSVRELTVKLIRCQKERRYAQSAIEQSITFSALWMREGSVTIPNL